MREESSKNNHEARVKSFGARAMSVRVTEMVFNETLGEVAPLEELGLNHKAIS